MKRSIYYRDSIIGRNFQYLDPADRFLVPIEKPQFKFNVIGTGMIGMEHIRITLLEGRGTVHGFYDSSPRSAKAGYAEFKRLRSEEECKLYNSLEEACNDPKADALIICTPNYTHLSVLETAVKSGKPILLEKPMATSLPDAYRILKIGREYSSLLQVGLQYRYKAIYQEAIASAKVQAALGNIKTIFLQEHRPPFLDKVGQWNKFSEYSGGTLVEKCCHYFDLFNYFAESKPVEVYAAGGMDVNFKDFAYEGRTSDILDNAFVTVKYANGIKALFSLCMFAPLFYEEITMCGDAGRLHASEQEDFMSGQSLKTRFQFNSAGSLPSKTAEPHYPEVIEQSGHNGATFFEHVNFIENLLGNPVDTSTADVLDGFWSVVVGAAAEASAKTGRPIQINELFETAGIDPADPLIQRR